MTSIKIPPIGTRVAVETSYTIEWMNFPRPPIIGILSISNAWDQPGTFRVTNREDVLARHKHDSVISIERVKSLQVLEPLSEFEVSSETSVTSKTFEIKGSKDNVYTVVIDGEKSSCDCQAGSHGRLCKHVKAAREMLAD